MQAKSERFELRLEQDTLDRVDHWRAQQADLPSRAEAIRRLVDLGIRSPSDSREVTISDGERLIIMMLRDLLKHGRVKTEIDPDFVAEALWGGHLWGLEWEYPGLFGVDSDRKETVHQVVDILDMWDFMEVAYDKLSKEEKETIHEEAGPLGKIVEFAGFDGNNESAHMSVAKFLVSKLHRFSRFANRDLNSHSPSLDGYLRMLKTFERMRPSLVGIGLTSPQIIELLNARMHPSYRRD